MFINCPTLFTGMTPAAPEDLTVSQLRLSPAAGKPEHVRTERTKGDWNCGQLLDPLWYILRTRVEMTGVKYHARCPHCCCSEIDPRLWLWTLAVLQEHSAGCAWDSPQQWPAILSSKGWELKAKQTGTAYILLRYMFLPLTTPWWKGVTRPVSFCPCPSLSVRLFLSRCHPHAWWLHILLMLNRIHLKINIFIPIHPLEFQTLITTLSAQLSNQFFHPGHSPYLSFSPEECGAVPMRTPQLRLRRQLGCSAGFCP